MTAPYKKRSKGSWGQGKKHKGDGEERQYAEKEISMTLGEQAEDHKLPYKKSRRNRNKIARLEYRINWYEEMLAKRVGDNYSSGFTRMFRESLNQAKKQLAKLKSKKKD